jgi:hypothetical protein
MKERQRERVITTNNNVRTRERERRKERTNNEKGMYKEAACLMNRLSTEIHMILT